MIYTTHKGPFGTQLGFYDSRRLADGPMFGETKAEMPELDYWMQREHSSDLRVQAVARHVASLPMWKALKWQPEAAERVLGWIRTGEWSPAVLPDGSRSSGLIVVSNEHP